MYRTVSLKSSSMSELLIQIRMKVKEGWTQDNDTAFSGGYYRTVMVKR